MLVLDKLTWNNKATTETYSLQVASCRHKYMNQIQDKQEHKSAGILLPPQHLWRHISETATESVENFTTLESAWARIIGMTQQSATEAHLSASLTPITGSIDLVTDSRSCSHSVRQVVHGHHLVISGHYVHDCAWGMFLCGLLQSTWNLITYSCLELLNHRNPAE